MFWKAGAMMVPYTQALVIDLGGVLLRTEDKGPRTQLAARFGMSYEQLDAFVFNSPTGKQAEAGLIPDSEHHRYLMQSLNIRETDLPEFFDQFFAGDRLDEDLLGFLHAYRGKYLLGLLSNAWRNAAETLRRRYCIHQFFDFVIFSAEVRLAKPDPEIFRLVEEKSGIVPAKIIFLDDNETNIEAARMAGWQAIQFRSAGQAKQDILHALADTA